MSLPAPLEKEIQAQCLDFLRLLGAFAIRVNSSAFVGKETATTRRRFVRSNSEEGCSDLIVCMPDGRFAAVEVKRPGGKATEKQLAFIDRVRATGGLGIVVKGVDDLRAALKLEGYEL